MNILTRTALGTLTASAAFLAAGAGTASAAATTACPDGISPAFSKVQLFNGANCGGGSMIVRNDDASPNRPNFAKFRNYDGKVYDVQNNRSSLTVAKGTCVRLYDGANYTGASSPNICATAGTVEWNLTELDNRASSMRVTAAGAPTPSPTPTPTPTPTPAPSAGGFPADVQSAPDTSKYDDAGPYNKGKGCTKGFTPGAKKLQAWLRANFGAATIQGFSCRPNTASTSKPASTASVARATGSTA